MKKLVVLENASLFLPDDPSRKLVLRHINWEIVQGGHWALLGPNGSGKSTLLRLLHGELWLCEGNIKWRQAGVFESSPLAGRAISAIVSPAEQENCQRRAWQTTVLDALLGAREDYPLSFSGLPAKDAENLEEIEGLMRGLNSLDLLSRVLPELSQGQLRLVLLARALLRKPELLLLDECADGLDPAHKSLFFQCLESVSDKTAIICAAHRRDSLPSWLRNKAFLREGELSIGGEAGDVRPLPSAFSSLALRTSQKPAASPEAIFRLENVDVYVERRKVLRGINWLMREGEHWRLDGANGSGKSTFLRLLAGEELAAAGGGIWRRFPKLNGQANSLQDIRACLSLASDLAQAVYAYPLSGLELVCSGFDNSVGLYRQIREEEKDLAMSLIKAFFPSGMAEEMAEKSIRGLSSGQLRRLHLARCLVNRPDVLLLDEPCSGLDAESRAAFLGLLDDLAAGLPGWRPLLVFVSHYAEDAPKAINRHARMVEGRLLIEK